MMVTCSTQLIAVKGAAHYVVNHSDKMRQKDRKNLPQVVVPGLESERKDRGELTRWERGRGGEGRGWERVRERERVREGRGEERDRGGGGGGGGGRGVFTDCCSAHPTLLVLTC